MTRILKIIHEGTVVRSHRLDPRSTFRFGNSDCEVPLRFPTVSRNHGTIRTDAATVTAVDHGSRNGTKIAGKALIPDEEAIWPEGVPLEAGPFRLIWNSLNASGVEAGPENTSKSFVRLYSRLLSEAPAEAGEKFAISLDDCPESSRAEVLQTVHNEFHGDGPLKELLNDARCKEILLNDFDEIFADLGDGLFRTKLQFSSAETYFAWAVRKAAGAGRRLDLQNPLCEATLENGARFHAILPPIAPLGLCVSIRRFGSAPLDEATALETRWFDADAFSIMRDAIVTKKNIVISGGTSTGKTSLLNFLCRYIAPSERLLTVEDTLELDPPVAHLVQLQARRANADGVGEIPLRALVQSALRMRPDRIVVGECRGPEVLDMLQALNTGHPGSLTTIHANSTGEAMHRMELLALLAASNLSVESIKRWIQSSVDMVIQLERDERGHRHVLEIVGKQDDEYAVLYRRGHDRPMALRACASP